MSKEFGCGLPELIRRLGDDIVFYATDVPHWDHDFPENLGEMASREDLSPREPAEDPRRQRPPHVRRNRAQRLTTGLTPGPSSVGSASPRGHVLVGQAVADHSSMVESENSSGSALQASCWAAISAACSALSSCRYLVYCLGLPT
jgi:hypothetical protein